MFRYAFAYLPIHGKQKPCQDPSPNSGLQTHKAAIAHTKQRLAFG